jgi:hypothetical protein
MAGVCQAGKDILVRQAGIVRHYVGFRLSGRKQVEDELGREPGTSDNRLARKHLGIDHDTIRPGHALIIPRRGTNAAHEFAQSSEAVRATIGLPLDEQRHAAARYLSTTADEVRSAFSRRIRPDDFVTFVRGPAPR